MGSKSRRAWGRGRSAWIAGCGLTSESQELASVQNYSWMEKRVASDPGHAILVACPALPM